MFAFKCAVFLCAAAAAAAFELGANDVVFHLFTEKNPTVSQPLLPSINHILQSNFSPFHRTILTIHSSGEGVGGNFNAHVVTAHLETENVNIIAVDWSAGSAMYTQGLGNAEQCGDVIAQFINLLSSFFGYGPQNFRIVGVGLGGHIAGIAARKVNGNIPHIVAIDPSLHGWTHNPNILTPNDATIVEVLHATAGHLGYDYPLGDLDFYPNGGSYQFGCGNDVACSLTYAYAFYAESIRQAAVGGAQFVGTACESYDEAITLSCSGAKDAIFGGVAVKTSGSGIYIFLTNAVPPFAQG